MLFVFVMLVLHELLRSMEFLFQCFENLLMVEDESPMLGMVKVLIVQDCIFITRRVIEDNMLVAQELVHLIYHSKSKVGDLMFKIDLEKAYNRVDWDFLASSLNDFGFLERIIHLIIHCVAYLAFSLLQNGNKCPSFNLQKAKRQGDPLSPYIFVICMEKFSFLINERAQSNSWKPLKCSRHGPNISLLFFVNDVLLFSKASPSLVNIVIEIIKEYCNLFGLEGVHPNKSRVMFSPSIHRSHKHRLKDINYWHLIH